MSKYRKKPVVIEAIQIPAFFKTDSNEYPKWFVDAVENGTIIVYRGMMTDETKYVGIKTLEGEMMAFPNDYIIRDVNGEYYPCKPDIFEKTYEKVED